MSIAMSTAMSKEKSREKGLPIKTAFGTWHIVCDEQGLTRFSSFLPPGVCIVQDDPLLSKAAEQIKAYFNGRQNRFFLPLHIKGTPFQKAVWEALRTIPYGQTRTYSQIAEQIGRPTSCRAVGNACAQNPLLLFIPCHRVLAANGIGGFTGGLSVKQALLQLEKRYAADFTE